MPQVTTGERERENEGVNQTEKASSTQLQLRFRILRAKKNKLLTKHFDGILSIS